MRNEGERSSTAEDQVMQNARLGYQVAVDVWLYELQIAWARFDSMLIANSIVVAAIAALIASDRPQPEWLMIFLAIVGILLCLVWFQMIERNLGYRWYWFCSALELEDRHLSSPLKMLAGLERFARGKSMDSDVQDFSDKCREWIGFAGRLLKTAQAGRVVICLFVTAYAVLLVFLIRSSRGLQPLLSLSPLAP